MSFNEFKRVIQEGDTVILCVSFKDYHSLEAKAKIVNKKGVLVDNVFQTSYGAVRCAELIGKEFGSKLMLTKGHVYILQPTPELWTLTLPHRTQIIYTPDISMILMQLELKPGSVVIESGTGSGSLSHALIRTIKPHGFLHTFDFHEERTRIAQEEFTKHGFGDFVKVRHRDVCADGFGDELEGKVDAIFLDLPHPWLAIPHAKQCLKVEGGRICSFSPCIEQVQKSCASLRELGFNEIETMEVLQTQYSVQTRNLASIELNFLRTAKTEDDSNQVTKEEKQTVKCVTTLPPNQQPGHTGFLTFATLPPQWALNIDSNDD